MLRVSVRTMTAKTDHESGLQDGLRVAIFRHARQMGLEPIAAHPEPSLKTAERTLQVRPISRWIKKPTTRESPAVSWKRLAGEERGHQWKRRDQATGRERRIGGNQLHSRDRLMRRHERRAEIKLAGAGSCSKPWAITTAPPGGSSGLARYIACRGTVCRNSCSCCL